MANIFNTNELAKRTLSATILLFIIAPFIWYGGEMFRYLSLVITAILFYEWWGLLRRGSFNITWAFLALVHGAIPFLFFGLIRESANGFYTILFLLYIVLLTDVGAYFIGKMYGKKKLLPNISPNKTWAGAVGGFLLALAGGIECYLYASYFGVSGVTDATDAATFWHFLLGAGIISIFCQLGDLFASWAKRVYGVKDFGNLIPGHGGLLDRIDGLLFATLPVAYYIN